jgi:hypothetical protein
MLGTYRGSPAEKQQLVNFIKYNNCRLYFPITDPSALKLKLDPKDALTKLAPNGNLYSAFESFFSKQYYAELVLDSVHYCMIVIVRPDLFLSQTDAGDNQPCILIFDPLWNENGTYFGGYQRMASHLRT